MSCHHSTVTGTGRAECGQNNQSGKFKDAKQVNVRMHPTHALKGLRGGD